MLVCQTNSFAIRHIVPYVLDEISFSHFHPASMANPAGYFCTQSLWKVKQWIVHRFNMLFDILIVTKKCMYTIHCSAIVTFSASVSSSLYVLIGLSVCDAGRQSQYCEMWCESYCEAMQVILIIRMTHYGKKQLHFEEFEPYSLRKLHKRRRNIYHCTCNCLNQPLRPGT